MITKDESRFAALAVCLAASAAGCAPRETSPVVPAPSEGVGAIVTEAAFVPAAPTGDLLFTSELDGNTEIYMVSASGGDPINLTRNPAEDFSASWSPDGARIAFLSDRSGRPEVFVMAADGSDVRNLTSDPLAAWWTGPLRWSPDGSRLLAERGFTFNDFWTQISVQVVKTDGGGWGPLYLDQPTSSNDRDAEWISESEGADFIGLRYTAVALFSVPMIGSSPTGLFVRGPEQVLGFAGSPDGREVALVSYSPDSAFHYHASFHRIARETGNELASPDASRLDPFGDFSLAWSPAGDRIALPATELRGHRELWMWSLGSTSSSQPSLTPATQIGGVHGRPSWSSDGLWVAFTAEVTGNDEIFVMFVGASRGQTVAPIRMTTSEGRDYDVVWRP